MMVREIITAANSSLTLTLPEEMIGKTVEVIAFEITETKGVKTKIERLNGIRKATENSLTDLSGFKFNRDEANNYGE